MLSVLVFTLLASLALCGVYLKLARRWQILDHPNARSSHQLATPHGGGIALFLALALAFSATAVLVEPWRAEYVQLLALSLALVVLGVLDDLFGLSIRLRFALYGGCCALAALLLNGAGGPAGPGAAALATVALLWLLNLYNFMDGIDGLAATQGIAAAASAAVLAAQSGAEPAYIRMLLLLAAAQAGFLFWNWPTARLFMGDAGSVPTGFLLGAMALLGQREGFLPLASWLILLGAFIVDASVTLLWRMATGQRFTQPHRQHAYQRLSRHLGGHLPVVLILLGINALWLFPLAWAAASFPAYGVSLVILAYLPLLAGMAIVRDLG